jgi:hypothetical protein
MSKRYIEQLIVAALGFLMGAVIAMSIAPGDVLMVIPLGIIFGFSARALFDQDFGGEWFWPFGRATGGETRGPKPSIGHR